jgi:hypothetical protein
VRSGDSESRSVSFLSFSPSPPSPSQTHALPSIHIGLTTLGLFRPFRLAESRPAQLKLILLFLDYTAEFDPSRASHPTSEASKQVLLHSWREELRYAEVVDVVGVIKWVR